VCLLRFELCHPRRAHERKTLVPSAAGSNSRVEGGDRGLGSQSGQSVAPVRRHEDT
jgi:hypothetical protein